MKESQLAGIAKATGSVLRPILRDIKARLDALEAMQAAHKNFQYRGVFEPGETYTEGDFVTRGGSLWACLEDTQETPGQSADWQLAVKRGRDGRAKP